MDGVETLGFFLGKPHQTCGDNLQFVCFKYLDDVADVAVMYYHFGDYLKSSMPEYFDYVSLPAEGNFLDQLAISRIRNAPHKDAAAAWIDFIRSDAAAAVYNRHGFDYADIAERSRVEDK